MRGNTPKYLLSVSDEKGKNAFSDFTESAIIKMSDNKAPSTPLSGVNPDQVSEKLRSNLACLQILNFL